MRKNAFFFVFFLACSQFSLFKQLSIRARINDRLEPPLQLLHFPMQQREVHFLNSQSSDVCLPSVKKRSPKRRLVCQEILLHRRRQK